MNEICQINNFNITKINSVICSLCKKIINSKSKKCKSSNCKTIICDECFNKQNMLECPICKKRNLTDNSISNINELLFLCKNSIKCKGQYTYEEIINNHSNENSEIIKCHNCSNNLNNNPNFLKCLKCKNYFCHKNVNYNPILCRVIKSSIKNCGSRCYKCFKPVCIKCNQNKYNYIICSECNFKCQICENNRVETICEICDKMLCGSCVKICKKCSMTMCHIDFKNKNECNKHKIKLSNNNKCLICNKSKYKSKCSICNTNICFLNCLIICNVSSCKKIICINCSLFCNICKDIICKNCSLSCSNCPKTKSLISCINCNSNTIFNCSVTGCSTKLCLKCFKFCNYCEDIICKSHSLSCANCSEDICRFHWHICKKCSEEKYKENFSQKKLCLKNCTYSCHFCENEINVFCKEENHLEDFCKKYLCDHYICNSCVKRCDDCEKVIQGCSECEIDNNFIHCRICGKSLCFDCANQCLKCDKYYCNAKHNCYLCKKEIKDDICPNCNFVERSKCIICSKGLTQCEACFKRMICSSKCFLDYYTSNNNKNNKSTGFSRSHTIQSNKSLSYKTNVTNNMINSVINLFQSNKEKEKEKEKNSTHYNNNFKNNKSEIGTDRIKHLCLMYWCDKHIGLNSNEVIMMKSNTLKDLISSNSSNNVNIYRRMNNQTSTKCCSCYII